MAIGCPDPLSAGTVVLEPVADAVIYSPKSGDSFAYANGKGAFLHAGVNGTSGGNRVLRSLLRFDVAAAVPAGATITQADLRVAVSKHSGTLRLSRLVEPWSEGTVNPSSGEGIGAALVF